MTGNGRDNRGAVLLEDRAGVVRAAGGMVVRRSRRGRAQVLVVHRPHRLDWTFPKGKVEPGEPLEACAVREVAEETGLTCAIGAFVGHTEYRDRKDRPKIVAYWAMSPLGADGPRDGEVDEMRWEHLDAAAALLSYDRDRELLGVLGAMGDLGALPA